VPLFNKTTDLQKLQIEMPQLQNSIIRPESKQLSLTQDKGRKNEFLTPSSG
jgi:hypothetical protein